MSTVAWLMRHTYWPVRAIVLASRQGLAGREGFRRSSDVQPL